MIGKPFKKSYRLSTLLFILSNSHLSTVLQLLYTASVYPLGHTARNCERRLQDHSKQKPLLYGPSSALVLGFGLSCSDYLQSSRWILLARSHKYYLPNLAPQESWTWIALQSFHW